MAKYYDFSELEEAITPKPVIKTREAQGKVVAKITKDIEAQLAVSLHLFCNLHILLVWIKRSYMYSEHVHEHVNILQGEQTFDFDKDR